MQRDQSSLAGRLNGGSGAFEVKNTGRKPLFRDAAPRTNDRNKENVRAQSTSVLGASVLSNGLSRSASADADRRSQSPASLRATRILQPGFSSSIRKQLSLSEALKVAEEESVKGSDDDDSVMDASPSPAPKVWLKKHEGDEKRMRKFLSQDHLDTKFSSLPTSRQTSASSTIPDIKSPGKTDSPKRRSFYGKPRIGLGQREPPSTLTNGTKPEGNGEKVAGGLRPPESSLLRHMPSKDDLTNQGRIPALVPGIEDLLPSIENHEPVATESVSPRKNLAWQIDDDLTMGDAQVSNSPRIKTGMFASRRHFDDGSEIDINSKTRVAPPGSRNTKLDEIRSREVKTGSDIPVDLPRPRLHNTKLDEIKDREEKVEHQIPLPDRNAPRPRNTKLDEIRLREIIGPNRRSLAQARLSEIREQNAMARSSSPEEVRPQTSRGVVSESKFTSEVETRIPTRPKSAFEFIGRRSSDPPVTASKALSATGNSPTREGNAIKDLDKFSDTARPSLSHRRTDSQDILRRLARAASSSPGPSPNQQRPASSSSPDKARGLSPVPSLSEPKSSIPRSSSDNGPRYLRKNQQTMEGTQEAPKPAVGFTDLPPRSRSTDSVKSKQSSERSEIDPTDRIEAEIDLFAPHENQSKKGSVRAPSPLPESEDGKDEIDPEATPRPIKQDPLTMPTPKVTGAYVETPATVKVEKLELKKEEVTQPKEVKQPIEEGQSTGERVPEKPAEQPKEEEKKEFREGRLSKHERPSRQEKRLRPRSTSLRRRRTEHVTSGSDRDSTSDQGINDKVGVTTSSSAARKARNRSQSRQRLEKLRNSVSLPTAKGDLTDIRRSLNIDDSTLDDLDEVVNGRKAPSRELEILLDNLPKHPTAEDDSDFERELDTKLNTKSNTIDPDSSSDALARITRMNDRLKNSLYGIHTAARGIERLSEEVNHNSRNQAADAQAVKKEDMDTKSVEPKPEVDTKSNTSPTSDMDKKKIDKTSQAYDKPLADMLSTDEVSYVRLRVPALLYHRKPAFRLTPLGLLTLFLSLWYIAESAMCARYCRPTICSGGPCIWSPDDPTFGKAIPVKLDQWVTGGHGRALVDKWKEEVDDWIADLKDGYYGREITDVDVNSLSFEKRRQHRRRLRKKGLIKPRVEDPAQKAEWDSWHRTRLVNEKQEELEETGYDVVEEWTDASTGGWEETFEGDERVW